MRRFFGLKGGSAEPSTPTPQPEPSGVSADMDWNTADYVIARASSCLFALQLQLRNVSGQQVRSVAEPIRRGPYTHVQIQTPGGLIDLEVNDADDSATLIVRLPSIYNVLPEPVSEPPAEPDVDPTMHEVTEPEWSEPVGASVVLVAAHEESPTTDNIHTNEEDEQESQIEHS